jgi:DNA-binding PucR family transcriptional regulator
MRTNHRVRLNSPDIFVKVNDDVTARSLIAELAGELLDEQAALAAALVERVHADPAVPNDRDLREATRDAGIRIVEQLLARLRDGIGMAGLEPPAAAVAYAHEFAHRGIDLPVLLAVVRTGYAEFSRHWSARLMAETAPSEAALLALSASMLEIFAYIDVISTAFAVAYTAERERWSRSIEALRLDAVRSIIDGELVDPEVAAQHLGQRLDGRHRAFVVWSADEPALGLRPALETAAAQVAARAGSPSALTVALTGQVLAGWLSGSAADTGDDAITGDPLSLSGPFDVRASIGTPADGIAGFRLSHRQAMHARRVAQASESAARRVTPYAAVALAALASADLEHAREFVHAELGALAGGDIATNRIATTVRVFLEEGRSRARTSRRLGLHTNTIAYRLARGAELLGHELGVRPAEVHVALMLAPLVTEGLTPS